MRKQYKFIKHNKLKTANKQAKPPLAINDLFKRQYRIIVYRQRSKSNGSIEYCSVLSATFKADMFSIVLFVNPLYLAVLLCYPYVFFSFVVFSKFALLTLANLEKG